MIPISCVVSLPRLRISAVSGIPFPFPLTPLLVNRATQISRFFSRLVGNCSRHKPALLINSTIRLIPLLVITLCAAADGVGVGVGLAIRLISCIALNRFDDGDGSAAFKSSANSSFVLKTQSMANRPPSSCIFFWSMCTSVSMSLIVQPSRFWYLVMRFAISPPFRV